MRKEGERERGGDFDERARAWPLRSFAAEAANFYGTFCNATKLRATDGTCSRSAHARTTEEEEIIQPLLNGAIPHS